jgi:hypothetical protein
LRTIRKTVVETPFDGWDWSHRLDQGEVLDSSSWYISAAIDQSGDNALLGDTATFDNTSTSIRLKSGTLGKTYRVSNTVITSDDAEYVRSFEVIVVVK